MKRSHARVLVSVAAGSGRPILTVASDSMRPALRRGDMLAVESCAAAALRRGDVVVFEREGRIWAHRLLGRTTAGRLVVKGDARLRLGWTRSHARGERFSGRTGSFRAHGVAQAG